MRTLIQRACLGLALTLAVIPLSAQATRTWISGVGDDANPGSRTAPCKTFAGAISKTAAGGEIDCLDPGGFGAVTITKSITLDGGGGQVGSILVAGTNAIVVAAAATDVVVIRNLRFQGLANATAGGNANGGLNAIRFVSGKALIIENCTMDGFLDAGVDVALTTASNVSVVDTLITGTPGAANSNGIYVESMAAAAKVDLTRVSFASMGHSGIYCGAGTLTARGVSVTGSDYGFVAFGSPNVELDDSSFSDNNVTGLRVIGGTIRCSDCTIMGNATGISITGGTVNTFANNRISGNGSGNGPLGTSISFQ